DSFEESVWFPRGKHRACHDLDRHHRVAVTVKKLAPVSRPDRLVATLGRDRHFLPRARERPDVNLITTGFVGHVRQPAAVRRERWGAFAERCLEKRSGLSPLIGSKDPDV